LRRMSSAFTQRSSKPVATWLLVGVVMIMIQIILGGITRLTGSGLSITEWNVVTGALPPLNEGAWAAEFDKYKATPQYQLLNTDFTLKDFKFIFFWEWLHRLWARLIGIVFLVPFVIFLIQRRFRPEMVKPMIILFLLGALQGAVGWIMVASGLTGDAIYVKPTRLALHFLFAIALLGYTYWFALKLMASEKELVTSPRIRRLAVIVMIVLVLQLAYGALMAGNKAALSAPTWPDINGYMIPPGMADADEGLLNLLDNRITIHFIHRGLAYLLVLLIILLTVKMYRERTTHRASRSRPWPLVLVAIQLLLGVFSVLSSLKIIPNRWGIFEWMAQLHQVFAMLLFLSILNIIFIYRKSIQGRALLSV
jgi:cytochrome c oxidase assembly protein subunit 15